mgnify:CR=1 FL=1
MIGPLSYLDVALLAVCFISALLAMYRGLAREMLSILSWIVAFAATFYAIIDPEKYGGKRGGSFGSGFATTIAEDLAKQIQMPVQIAQIAVGAVIFLIVLIIVHLITARVSDAILDSRVGMIDRILGFMFGLARGFVLIVIPYMLYEAFMVDPKNPETAWPWVRNSQSLPYIQSAGNSIKTVLIRIIPSSLTTPSSGGSGEQQGYNLPQPGQVGLAYPVAFHISVTWRNC